MRSGVMLKLDDKYARRDTLWVEAFAVARRAVDTVGFRCLACGGRLWKRPGSSRLFCDDTCKRRHYRRRERYRRHLREVEQSCQLCGSDVA